MNTSKIAKTNLIFFILIALALVYIVAASVLGTVQDQAFNRDYDLYRTASTMLDQNQPNEAAPIFEELLYRHPDSYILMWNYAIALGGEGRYSDSSYFFAKAEAQRPFIVNNPTFLVQYGRILFTLGQYTQAEKYLKRVQMFTNDPKYLDIVDQTLKDINTKLGAKK